MATGLGRGRGRAHRPRSERAPSCSYGSVKCPPMQGENCACLNSSVIHFLPESVGSPVVRRSTFPTPLTPQSPSLVATIGCHAGMQSLAEKKGRMITHLAVRQPGNAPKNCVGSQDYWDELRFGLRLHRQHARVKFGRRKWLDVR
jgi:hypothetical protein